MRNENRAAIARHENELKELKENVSSSYLDHIKELNRTLDAKQKEIEEHNMSLAEVRRSIADLKERLQLSNQSRADADETIHSQKTAISELGAQLSEERNLRRGEREKAEVDLKSAVQRAHSEAQEEIKCQADVFLRQNKEQQEVISKLQETVKESCLLVETLRTKLEDARESLSLSEKKVRQLEVQVQDEQAACANSKRRSETLDTEVRRLTKELESEKVAREEAWAKVSSLELEIAAAIRDLSIEKQRFEGARARIILRETQLRAFYSTTEEISALFAKQQEQLKAMQKTLEDEENYANTLMGVDLNDLVAEAVNAVYLKVRDETHHGDNTREASGASTPKNIHATRESSDDSSTTEKHNCDMENQDGNTQDLECTSSDRLVKGFISDIDGAGTAVAPDGDINNTERVLGIESQFGGAGFDERISALHKCSNLAGNTLQLDDEVQIQENLEPVATEPPGATGLCSELRMEDDTETAATRTADLLASEVAGSWAVSTAPSVLGENESPRSPGDPRECTQDATASGGDIDAAAGSQSNVTRITKLSKERKALNSMIAVVAPEFGQQFLSDGGNKDDSVSDAETENGSDDSDSDDTEGDSVDDGNEPMIEDSVD